MNEDQTNNEAVSGMDDLTLLSIVEAEEDAVDNTQLFVDREKALDYYYGRATGKLAAPAIPNRSHYVSRDVADTVDWIIPALLKTFLSGDDVMEFSPRGPEDVEAAEQETDYVNYIVNHKNNAYEVFSAWFDDALIQKNGYVYVYWKESKDIQEESYQGISQDEIAMLTQDPDIEIAEANAYVAGVDETGQPAMAYDVMLKRTNKIGKVCIENIPPEAMLVSWWHRCVNLQDAPFCGWDDNVSLSELRENGYDVPDDINDDYRRNRDSYRDSYVRDQFRDNLVRNDTEDESTKIVRVRHRWIRADYDGDGIAELRYLMIVGREILENRKADIVPIAAITPRIVAHNHIGRSIEDVVSDLQELNTQFMRGMIDNVILSNNGRHAIDENVVNLDDMLVSRPGGVVRVNGAPGGAILPLNHAMLGAPVMSAIEIVSGIKENRTGVTRYNMGTDAGSLNKTATGVKIITGNANQRIEWIARTMAETGVKELFQIVHSTAKHHASKAEIVKLRNKWVTVDPRTWAKRTDMTISVGLGSTNREMQMSSLMSIGNLQKEAFPAGVVTPENIYNMAAENIKALGYKNPDTFFTRPEKMPQKEQKPDPDIQKMQAELQMQQQKFQAEQQQAQAKMQMDFQLAQQRLQNEIELSRQKMMADIQLERDKASMKAQADMAAAITQPEDANGFKY